MLQDLIICRFFNFVRKIDSEDLDDYYQVENVVSYMIESRWHIILVFLTGTTYPVRDNNHLDERNNTISIAYWLHLCGIEQYYIIQCGLS